MLKVRWLVFVFATAMLCLPAVASATEACPNEAYRTGFSGRVAGLPGL